MKRPSDFTQSLAARLFKILEEPGYRPSKDHDLARRPDLDASPRDIRYALRLLEREGKAVKSKGNRWEAATAASYPNALAVEGQLLITSAGFGIVVMDPPNKQEYFIPPAALGSAMPGDRVRIEPTRKSGRRRPSDTDKPEAIITAIITRHWRKVAGQFMLGSYYPYVIPGDPRIRSTLHVREVEPSLERIPQGDMVVLELDDPVLPARVQTGRVIQHLGPVDLPGVDMAVLMVNRGIQTEFPDQVLSGAKSISPTLSDRDYRGRRDLRDRLLITIDPRTAKDYDDAVSLEERDGDWILGVHIADVSHFVTPDSDIDLEARQRGNSVYMVDRFIPMLPKHLTADVCSLREGVDRLAYSVDIRIDKDGHRISAETYRSVIRSRACLVYEDVQAFLTGGESPVAPELRPLLTEMNGLALKLRALRFEAGAIDLALPEVECILDEEGRPVSLTRRNAPEAYHLIEEFMLAANCAVADRFVEAGLPGLYRIHEEPSEEQWTQMAVDLRMLGRTDEPTCREDLNRICRDVRGTPAEYAINLAMLKNFKRAMYTSTCLGHFGLAFPRYTHFTSPIRRYPDLLVHRILDALDRNQRPPYSKDELDAVGFHCSETERNADKAEEESLAVKRIQFYERRLEEGDIGPEDALVLGINQRGMMIEIVPTLQKGFIAFRDITIGYMDPDVDKGRVMHKGKVQYRVGDVLPATLLRVDARKRQIDFGVGPSAEATKDPDGRSQRSGRSGKRPRGGRGQRKR
ncbi:MAG TPA: VacB/RNase II family 3'-5' exoribonuclease [Kiritimatiellia bacterium]|nr:VacB/RNase II family 3'-5' exoribonuclease [Kiritimatiellia bacterium]